VQNFASELVGARKSKGIFITTGFFSPEVATLPELPPMEFIDGKRLAALLKQYEVSL
jgi:restriction endonuclease Mrr